MNNSLLDNIESERDNFEQLLDKLPGYKGYKEKEMRRESDMVVREALAARLQAQLRRIAPMQEIILRESRLELTDKLELNSYVGTLVTALQTLIDRIKAAPKGHGSLFSAVRVKEGELEALQAFDEELGSELPTLVAALDELGKTIDNEGNVRGATRQTRKAIDEMTSTFNKRSAVITGV